MASQYTPGTSKIAKIITVSWVIRRSKGKQMRGMSRKLNTADISNIPDCAQRISLWKICTILALQWLLLRNYIVCLAVVWAERKIHWCKIYVSWPFNICHSADGKTEFFSGFVSIDVIGWNEMKWNGVVWNVIPLFRFSKKMNGMEWYMMGSIPSHFLLFPNFSSTPIWSI